MKRKSVGAMDQLKEQVLELRTSAPQFSPDALFVLWFLRAFVAEDDAQARRAVVGASHDKGIDAVLIDHRAEVVFVVQGKYRLRGEHKGEKRSDVVAFAQLGGVFSGSDDSFAEYCRGLDPLVKQKVVAGRQRVIEKGYRVNLCYVTLARCSDEIERDARRAARKNKGCDLMLFDNRRVFDLLQRYMDGIAPAIPDMDLRVQPGEPGSPAVFSRSDTANNIASWVFTMSGEDVGNLFKRADVRIFAKNIRGYLGGDTEINKGMTETLRREPHFFWYFNNGVTIVCDDAEMTDRAGEPQVLRVTNPQIINGQQTTRTLDDSGRIAGKASVLVRVIRIPRGNANPDKIVSQIVQSTNWQNRISASDLMSNDPRQLHIERELRKLGYQYLRKRMTKREARRAAGGQDTIQMTKFELAQAVAGCMQESLPLRVGKEPLFENVYYPKIFKSGDPYFYLTRYWLTQRIKHVARTSGNRKFGRWIVQYFMWSDMGAFLMTHARRFQEASERSKHDAVALRHLDSSIEAVLAATWDFYGAMSKTMEERLAAKPFFQRANFGSKSGYDLFVASWRRSGNRHRLRYRKAVEKFKETLTAA